MNYGNGDHPDAYLDKEGFQFGHEDFKVPMATETERDESSLSSESQDDSLKPQERETWTRKIDFLLACIGFSVGLGNVWRFPYLCYKNGGGAFLLPYVVCAALGGIPVFFLEVALGQFMSSGGIGSWKICPLMQGIGLATTVIVFLLNVYYNVILGWAIYYLFNSFTSLLPWSHCNNAWNTPQCVRDIHIQEDPGVNSTVLLGNASDITSRVAPYALVANGNSSVLASLMKNHTDPVTEFWERKVLQLSTGIDDVGTIRWELALCLLLAWVIVYFCIWKGIKTSGKVMYFTATAPYVLMTVLLIRGVTLPGALDGIKFYLLPDWEKLADMQVWVGAGTQIFFSYSISVGTLTALGSYNKFHHNSYKDSIIFAMCNSLTSFFAGFAIFSVLGFMAHQQGVGVGEVAESGPGLAFIAYPKAVAEMPVAPLWSILFFCMILLLGLDSQFVGVEGFVTSVQDMFPDFLRKGRRREIFIALVCLVSFFIGLSMITNGGIYVFMLFDYYSGSRIILIVAFFECVIVAWFYGVQRFYDNLEMMFGYRINPYMKICWTIVTPLFTLGIFSLCIYSYSDLTYNRHYHYPRWALNIGWLMACTSVSLIPIFMVIQLIRTPGSLSQRFKTLLRPRLKPHQLRPQDSAADLDCDQIYSVTNPNTECMLPEYTAQTETCLSKGSSPIYTGDKTVQM